MIIHQNAAGVNYYFIKKKKRGLPRILAARIRQNRPVRAAPSDLFFLMISCLPRIAAASWHFLSYRSFQMSLLYSAIVLSEEKKPAFAMLTSIIFLHFF